METLIGAYLMINILIFTDNRNDYTGVAQKLAHRGFSFSYLSKEKEIAEEATNPAVDILAIDVVEEPELTSDSILWDQLRELGEHRKMPVIAIVPPTLIELLVSRPEINDFIARPIDPLEVEVRLKRCLKLVGTGAEIIKSGDMVIDLAQAEVYIGGKPVELTFKEYELLKFLASNKNRVYKRETLLNELWGYDYFGGDRTVDVHIRRLRSKIEDPEHTFIETVRNMGYKFKSG